MANQAHLCPACAAHLLIDDAFTTMRCDNCNSSLVFARRGGVSGLLLLPDAAPVPYSNPPVSLRALDGLLLAESAWRGVLSEKLRRRNDHGSAFAVFAMLTALTALGALAALHRIVAGQQHSLESATLVFLLCLTGMPVLGFVAAFFWNRYMATHHEIRSVMRRISG